MRKLVIGMALASTALATPVLAREDAWYVEVDGGAMIVEDSKYDLRVAGPAGNTGRINDAMIVDHDYGYDFGGIVGYDFGGFRVEMEASYRSAGADEFSTATGFRVPASRALSANNLGTFTGNIDAISGDSSVLSFLLNGLLDFGDDDGLQGFVGGGVGVGRVDADYTLDETGPGIIDDSDTGLAWQALAGVRYPVSQNWDIGLKYRFFNVDSLKFVDTSGRELKSNWRSHSLLATIAYNFGAPTPPPPPPPPPPPVVCNKGPFIVFFDWDKYDITPEAATILDSAVSAYANCARVPVMIAGHTDTSGSKTYNQGLSERRAGAVKDYFVSRGIAPDTITAQGFGETMLRVPTADGVREPQNRRVEITYGPGSGM